MGKTERLIGLWSQESHTASAIVGAQQLMQLSDEESCNNSSHGSNGSSRAMKGQSKGSDHRSRRKVKPTGKKKPKAVLHQRSRAPGQPKGSDHPSRHKATSAGKMKTRAVHDQDKMLLPLKKRKYRRIGEIYAEAEPMEARTGDDHRGEDHDSFC